MGELVNLNNLQKNKIDCGSREYKHKNRERLCYCCDTVQDTKDKINVYEIHGRGYGSDYDSCSFEIQLCDKCKEKVEQKWFDEIPEYIHEYCENYKYEKDITNFVKSFILENQEYIWNNMGDGYYMERQDWLDMKNGILPDEKYKEYGMYSPSEIKSYEERFPTCEYPVNRVYHDGSRGCWCPFDAYGEVGQIADEWNTCNECHYCNYYKPRETPIKDIKDEYFEDYQLYIISNLRQDELNKKFNIGGDVNV